MRKTIVELVERFVYLLGDRLVHDPTGLEMLIFFFTAEKVSQYQQKVDVVLNAFVGRKIGEKAILTHNATKGNDMLTELLHDNRLLVIHIGFLDARDRVILDLAHALTRDLVFCPDSLERLALGIRTESKATDHHITGTIRENGKQAFGDLLGIKSDGCHNRYIVGFAPSLLIKRVVC